MGEAQDRLDELIEKLKRQRDELALQIHLGKAEAKEEWEKLEKKWEQLKAQRGPLKEAMDESAKDLGAALSLLGEELKSGYQRIKKLLSD